MSQANIFFTLARKTRAKLNASAAHSVFSAESHQVEAPVELPIDPSRADLFAVIRRSGLFDAAYYRDQNPHLSGTEDELLEHYLDVGCPAFYRPNPYFDAAWYLNTYPDISEAGMRPLVHYIMHGDAENRWPGPRFNTPWYRHVHSIPTSQSALLHYLDQRLGCAVAPLPEFDSAFYIQQNPNIAEQKLDPFEHFVRWGFRTGYNPSRDPSINVKWYVERYLSGSLAENPFYHWLGWRRAAQGEALEPLDEAKMQAEFDELWSSSATRKAIWSKDYALAETPSGQADTIAAPGDLGDERYLPIKSYPGKVPHRPNRPNVLLVAHIAAEYLFGSERSLLDMLDGLASLEINVFVALPRNAPSYTNLIRLQAEQVFVFDYGWWRNAQPVSERVITTFCKLIEENAIHAVHANTIMLRECLEAARRCKSQSVVHVRELITQDKQLVSLIGESLEDIVAGVHSRADWVIGNSQATADALMLPGRTHLIQNTIDVDAMDIPNPVTGERVRFGLISSNIPKKGLYDLVELAQLADALKLKADFLLIGPDTPEIKELKHKVETGDLPGNIIFSGYAETPKEAVSKVQVVLNLSNFAESFGRTVLEAMAARRPVVAYAWGALPELIEHEVTGYLTPFKNVGAVLWHVKMLCETPDLIADIGQRARAAAVQKFGLASYRKAFCEAYRSILPDFKFEPPLALDAPLVRPARRPGLKTRQTDTKIAYFCWHFPVPSETFVLNELRVLVQGGADVIVFCRQIPNPDFQIDFPIHFERINTHEDLARRLTETGRTMVHAHFAFPTVTNMVWPACEAAQIPFTFIAHAQDIFVYKNAEQNRLAEIGASPWCRAMFTLSRFHLDYVVSQGFPSNKVIINPNAVELGKFAAAANPATETRSTRRVIAIHRFVEKKGLSGLIRAASLMRDLAVKIEIYGYGPLETEYRDIVAGLELDNVTIHGALSQADIPAVLAGADLFACPSVRTATGDMDGIPTSMIESMAARLPVLATSIAGIPEVVEDGLTGILCEPTPEGIAAGIRRYYRMDTLQVRAMIDEASKRVAERHDATRLVDTLRRVWDNVTVDIVIVAWNNLAELRMVVDAILANTATPYHLIICDNMSRKEPVGAYLDELWAREDRVTVVHNNRNAMVGPGTNLAIAQGNSDTIIYVCGKEGVSFANGWEMSFVRAFTAEDIGMVGSLGYSPSYLTGDKYPSGIRLFDKFRNTAFATDNPSRIFRHIQGGLFAMRRRMVDEIGGFSDDVPHDYTDVEYSFYAESKGWRLAEADHVLALFNKSRPSLSQRFREDITVAHPVLPAQLPQFKGVIAKKLRHCNICDWFGEDFQGEARACPTCESLPPDRSLFRWLSDSTYMFRRLPALSVGLEGKMQAVWAEQFQGPRLSLADFVGELSQKGRLPNAPGRLHIAALRFVDIDKQSIVLAAKELMRILAPGGKVLLQLGALQAQHWDEMRTTILSEISKLGFETVDQKTYSSCAIRYSFLPIAVFIKPLV